MHVMARFLEETPRDQEVIDYLIDQSKKLGEENRKLREEIDRLKKEMEEYRKRHPSTTGIKNGKAYFIMEEHPKREKRYSIPP